MSPTWNFFHVGLWLRLEVSGRIRALADENAHVDVVRTLGRIEGPTSFTPEVNREDVRFGGRPPLVELTKHFLFCFLPVLLRKILGNPWIQVDFESLYLAHIGLLSRYCLTASSHHDLIYCYPTILRVACQGQPREA